MDEKGKKGSKSMEMKSCRFFQAGGRQKVSAPPGFDPMGDFKFTGRVFGHYM